MLAALLWMLNRTKIGLLIRAGVQDREMVESLGYRIRRLFVGVFVAGSALAGLGGSLWGMNQQIVVPQIGGQVNVLLFIVIIIGGLGSTLGCLVGALLVGLLDQLRRLPRAQADDVLEHRPDGRGADLAAAGPLSGDESVGTAMLDRLALPRPAAQPLAGAGAAR